MIDHIHIDRVTIWQLDQKAQMMTSLPSTNDAIVTTSRLERQCDCINSVQATDKYRSTPHGQVQSHVRASKFSSFWSGKSSRRKDAAVEMNSAPMLTALAQFFHAQMFKFMKLSIPQYSSKVLTSGKGEIRGCRRSIGKNTPRYVE